MPVSGTAVEEGSRRRSAARRAVRSLAFAALAGGVLGTLTGVATLAGSAGVFRLRELEWMRWLRRTAERFDVDLLAGLPAAFSIPLPHEGAGDVVRFLAPALATSLGASIAVAVLVAPVFVGLALAWPDAFSCRRRSGLVGPSLTLALLCAPAIEGPLRTATQGIPMGPSIVWALAIAGALGLLGVAALRRWAPSRDAVLRMRRAAIGAGGAAVLASVAAQLASPHAGPSARPVVRAGAPNVLLVSIDTLRADHVHAYGYARETTPAIDRLAAEGVRFDLALAPAPWTLPSHVSLLTGLPPLRHGVLDDGRRLAAEAVTLAEALRDAGYTTAGFVSAPYLEADYGFAQGFDRYDDYTVSPASEHFSHRAVTSPRLLDAVTRWLDERESRRDDRPFFLFVHMWDPHYDFVPPPPFDRHFDPDYAGPVTGDDFERGGAVHAGMDPRDLAHVVALYDGEIAFTDLHLGRILDRLRASGALDRTLVVVTGDHGEEFFEHGTKGHRQNLYDTVLRVPFVMRLPGAIPGGVVVERQVRLLDVAPTILGVVGLDAPAGFAAGPGAAGAAGGGEPPARDLRPLFDPALDPTGGGAAPGLPAAGDLHGELGSLRTERAKLVFGSYKGRPVAELYDLAVDPGEQRNLVGMAPALEAPLRDALARTRQGIADEPALSRDIQLDEDHRRRLRALGYVE